MREQEPILARPALRSFVEAARAQVPPSTRVTALDVQRGLAADRRQAGRTRRGFVAGSLLGVAAGLIAAWVALGSERHGGGEQPTRAMMEQAPPKLDLTPVVVTLDPAVKIRSAPDATPPRILGPWAIGFDQGVHEVELGLGEGRSLAISVPDGTIELAHGRLRIDVVGMTGIVRLESGVAAWIEPDGTRTAISVEHIDLVVADVEQEQEGPSAADLARRAERHLLAGERETAIETLRRLVRRHPRAAQTRAALMDLAAQERLAGRSDRARCAYRLYLERWPHSEVRAEIDKQLTKLGSGPDCRGLDPR